MMQGTMMKLDQDQADGRCLAVTAGSGSSAAELINGIALRANIPAINAAIGAAPSGQRAERVASWPRRCGR